MKLGKEAMEALQAEVTGCLHPGDELLVVAPVALAGTEILAKEKHRELKEYFSPGFLCKAEKLWYEYGVTEMETVRQMAREAGATAWYEMGEGGFLSALWKMAEASQVGLTADLRKVPIRQESIEICEIFDVNPYRLYAKGAVLVGIPSGETLAFQYDRMGISAAVIGQTNSRSDRLLYSGGNVRYLERPVEDEIKGVVKTWQD